MITSNNTKSAARFGDTMKRSFTKGGACRPRNRFAKSLGCGLACLLLSGGALTPVSAELVYGYVAREAPAQSERVFGVPFDPATLFTGTITSAAVTDAEAKRGTVAVAGEPWQTGAFGETGEAAYLRVQTGARAGVWYPILDNTTNELTVDTARDHGGPGLAALAAEDGITIHPYQTLDQILPEGGGLAASGSPSEATGDSILLYDAEIAASGINVFPEQIFIYYDGDNAELDSETYPAGWYQIGETGGPHGDRRLTPDAILTLRTAGSARLVTLQGFVPTGSRAQPVLNPVAPQPTDNRVLNPFPLPVSLAQLGLGEEAAPFVASDSPFAPEGDRLLVYPAEATGTKLPPAESYFYYSGAAGVFDSGWKREGQPSLTVDAEAPLIPPGGSFVVRKSSASPADPIWTLEPTYNLD